jgi:hypothetical protein
VSKLTEREKTIKATGSYVDRFFIYMKEDDKPLEVCSPRLLVAEFFDYLKREGAIRYPPKKEKHVS